MVIKYECKRCGYSTNIRKVYLNHVTKKNECKPNISNIKREELIEEIYEYILKNKKCGIKISHNETQYLENKCAHCNKRFSSKNHLNRHENETCAQLDKQVIKKLKNENKRLKNEKCIVNINNITTSNINSNNITNNIYVYGLENINYITQEVLKKVHLNPYENISSLVGLIHYNQNHPENQNVRWVNINKPNVLRYEKNIGWKSRKKEDVIQDMNDQAYFTADSIYDPKSTKLTEYQKKHYEKFRRDYDNKDKSAVKRLEQETERMILDKRRIEKIGL
jgi:hypothetical protein